MMKKYISPGSWFSFEYPNEWHEFEDEAGSFLFYNPMVWTGNFRISASMNDSPDFARTTLRDELAQYTDAEMIEIGGRELVYSRESFQEQGVWYTTHFWVTGQKQMAVYASFTCAKGEPVDEALALLASLKIMNPKQPQCHESIPVRLMEVALINEAYERVQKEVKQALKKDFSTVDVATGIKHLQQILDEGKMKLTPQTCGRVALVLGCFLIDEVDGVEWVTRIDGFQERPALHFVRMNTDEGQANVIDPVKWLTDEMAILKVCDLKRIYERMKCAEYSAE